jgi:hypothetical protein
MEAAGIGLIFTTDLPRQLCFLPHGKFEAFIFSDGGGGN